MHKFHCLPYLCGEAISMQDAKPNEPLSYTLYREGITTWNNFTNTSSSSSRRLFLEQTAISYMCSTNITHFLEALLQVPGIDINKPDNELNTPMHYAAECGKCQYLFVFF